MTELSSDQSDSEAVQETAKPAADARERRDARALVVAELLRLGWTGRQVSVGIKIIDAGGSVSDALTAMRESRLRTKATAEPSLDIREPER
jgi:hypothetical protein